MTLNNSYFVAYSVENTMTKTCGNCGTVTHQDDQYCSSCGAKYGIAKQVYQSYSKADSPLYVIEQTKSYIRLLGMIELAFGIVTLFGITIGAMVLSLFLSPEFFQSVGAEIPSNISINLNSLFAIIWIILILIGISSIIDIIGGTLLLQQKKSGKIFTYISAVFSLLNVPIGTAYAIGAFWILSKPETDEILR